MYYCPKCKITIRGKKTCCPLCEGKILTGVELKRTGIDESVYNSDDFTEDYNEAFPILNTGKMSGSTFKKICTFLLAIVFVMWITLKYLFKDAVSWMDAFMLGTVVAWADIMAIMRYRYNVLKVLALEVLFVIIIDYYIDRVTGFRGWSVIWMIPFCLVGHSAVTFVISKFMKLRFVEYIIYIIMDAVLAFGQIYFIWNGENTLPYAAVFVIAAYTIAIIAAIIFRYRELKFATEKMFNV